MKIRLCHLNLMLVVLSCICLQAAEYPEGRPTPHLAVTTRHPEWENIVVVVVASGEDSDVHGENKLIVEKLGAAKLFLNALLKIRINSDIKYCARVAALKTKLNEAIEGHTIIDTVKQRLCKIMFIVKGDEQTTQILQLLRGDTVQGVSLRNLFGDVVEPIYSVILFDPTVAEGSTTRHAIIPNYAYIAHKIYNFYSQTSFGLYRTLYPAALDQPVDENFRFKAANLCCKIIDENGRLVNRDFRNIDDIDFDIIARAILLADDFNLHATFNVLLDDMRARVAGASRRVCPVPLVWIRDGYGVEIQDFGKAKLGGSATKQLNYRLKMLVARSGVQRRLKEAEQKARSVPGVGYVCGTLMRGAKWINRQAGAADEFYVSQPIPDIAMYQRLAHCIEEEWRMDRRIVSDCGLEEFNRTVQMVRPESLDQECVRLARCDRKLAIRDYRVPANIIGVRLSIEHRIEDLKRDPSFIKMLTLSDANEIIQHLVPGEPAFKDLMAAYTKIRQLLRAEGVRVIQSEIIPATKFEVMPLGY